MPYRFTISTYAYANVYIPIRMHTTLHTKMRNMKKKATARDPDARDTKILQIEMPIDLYNFLHDCVTMQNESLNQLVTRELMDSARRVLNDGLSPVWFDAEAVARKYNLTSLLYSKPEPKTPSESVLKPSGGD